MADRARWLGDPAATSIPLEHLLSPLYLTQQSQRLERNKRMEEVLPGTWPEGTNTTQFTVVDHEGNVVSVTSTVEAPWGSGILVPGYGFFLNSELTDFNLKPQAGAGDPGANDVRPQRRPRSSMTPTLVFKDNQWVAAYGSPGGVSIISTVLEMTQDLLDDVLTPEAALRLPRYAVMDAQGHTLVEKSLAPAVIDQLRARGHDLTVSEIPLGSVQWVGENPQTHERQGAADARRDGTVIRLLP
ncbi:Gamma-glutamyltranspeptidase (fragment) [mine drainage metagenome]|uniref:Gamma-glutamyltranspeptidase n=1 Tax=mine drainage metagenome TaxID=410659 RepID=A0A3P3ZP63_9ZZZZ